MKRIGGLLLLLATVTAAAGQTLFHISFVDPMLLKSMPAQRSRAGRKTMQRKTVSELLPA